MTSAVDYLIDKHKGDRSDLGILARHIEQMREDFGEVEYELEELKERQGYQRWRTQHMLTIYRPQSERLKELPYPRLQLRWAEEPWASEWICHYELVFSLQNADCRGKWTRPMRVSARLALRRSAGAANHGSMTLAAQGRFVTAHTRSGTRSSSAICRSTY